MPQRQKKRVYKKTKPLSASQVKAVARIAKRVDLRNDETKLYRTNASNAVSSSFGAWYMNVLDNIPQGNTAGQREGNKINLRGVDLKFEFSRTSVAAASDYYARVTVVEHPDPYYVKGMTTWSNAVTADFYNTGIIPIGKIKSSPMFRVLYDKSIKMPVIPTSGYASSTLHKYLRIGKDFTYDGSPTGTTTRKILVILSWYSPNPAANSGLTVNHNVSAYYKDA